MYHLITFSMLIPLHCCQQLLVTRKTGSISIQSQVELVKPIRQPDIDLGRLGIALANSQSSQDPVPLGLVSNRVEGILALTLPGLSQWITQPSLKPTVAFC